ncbi:uncharacterized protein LOC116430495 isoform X2 [Nomia melanderi]|uniref:uncharacterized protein LOC116430495 isoform X2 n=1 Tax=Nomia melanderi TaxID=2448451 RepID=UPI003FCEBD4B
MDSPSRDKSIIPPGMQLKLIVSFYCNMIDEPEEILVVNVQNGKPLIIRLQGVKDPPILLEMDQHEDHSNDSKSIHKTSIVSHPEPGIYSRESTIDSQGTIDSWNVTCARIRNIMFDCKKSFVGEEVQVAMKFKNIGGEGRFFIMGEIDWCSMYIEILKDSLISSFLPESLFYSF